MEDAAAPLFRRFSPFSSRMIVGIESGRFASFLGSCARMVVEMLTNIAIGKNIDASNEAPVIRPSSPRSPLVPNPLARSAALALLALLSFGEIRLFDRLLYVDAEQFDFVLTAVDGVLTGRPVSKSWQHRLLPAAMVRAVQLVARDRPAGLAWFEGSMLVAANLCLFWIARRNGNDPMPALGIVAAFVLVHSLLLFKLEYPWDGIDVLIFLFFGHYAARGIALLRLWPLLAIGVLNHETILYVPLWFLLAPLDPPLSAASRRDTWLAMLALGLLVAAVLTLRTWLYVGRPDLPASLFEVETPGINNHLHVRFNLRQWFVEDWHSLKLFISVCLSATVVWLAIQLRRAGSRRLAVWTSLAIASVVCFGYINETRHYLPLLAFYFAHRCPQLTAATA